MTRNRECRGGYVLTGQGKKGANVIRRIGADLKGHGIAAMFTFNADPPRKPPDKGMEKEQGLHETLEHIDPVIPTPDMREFVGKNGFHRSGPHTSCHACREKYDKMEETKYHGGRELVH